MEVSASVPLVSILMRVYNTAEYLAAAIQSVLNERFLDFELLICDDASSDGSYEIAKRYSEIDSRIRLFRQSENMGKAGLVEKFLSEKARGQYLIVSDSDDVVHPDRLAVLVPYALKHSDCTVVYGRCEWVDSALAHQHDLGRPFSVYRLFDHNYIPNGVALYRRDDYLACGGIDPRITWAEDWHLRLKLAMRGRFSYLPTYFPLYQYRQHNQGWTAKKRDLGEEMGFRTALIQSHKNKLSGLKLDALTSFQSALVMYSLSNLSMRHVPVKRPILSFSKYSCLKEVLSDLGLNLRDTVLAQTGQYFYHRSFSRSLISAIQSVISPNGLMMMPAFTCRLKQRIFSPDWSGRPKVFRDKSRSSWVLGVMAENFRKRSDVSCNFHPAFRFSFWGKNSRILAQKYDFSDGLSEYSPLGYLYEQDAKLLIIDGELSDSPIFYLAEYLAGLAYTLYEEQLFYVDDRSGQAVGDYFRVVGHSRFDCFDRLVDLQLPGLPIRRKVMGDHSLIVLSVRPLVDLVVSILNHFPEELLCADKVKTPASMPCNCRKRRGYFEI